MEAIGIKEKLFGVLQVFEKALKQKVALQLKADHSLELSSPKLKLIYPQLKHLKYLSGSLNLDIPVLVKIMSGDLGHYFSAFGYCSCTIS